MTFILFTILVFVLDVGTSIPVAIRTKSLEVSYIKKPSIILGDLIIIPFIGGIILSYYHSFQLSLTELFPLVFLVKIAAIAMLLAVISVLRFKTASVWYLPHGLFYILMAFLILLFLIGDFNMASISWWLVLIGIGVHLYLGKKYPKVFPKIK